MSKIKAKIEISEEVKRARQQNTLRLQERKAKLADIEASKAKGILTQDGKLDIIIKQNDLIIELLAAR